MNKTTKTFDCVEMKNQIQAEMYADYEANRDKYPSFVDYIKDQADKSSWVRQWRKNANVFVN